MTISSGIALFIAMALSAAIPGPSVLAVVSRSIVYGSVQGLLVVVGVLVADYIFIFLAISGLSLVASLMGEFAVLIKYVGVTYLLWLAYVTWTSEVSDLTAKKTKVSIKSSSLITGMLMTLSNPKAILFYMGFFPAFVDLTALTALDVVSILLLSTISVGGILATYACAASKASFMFKGHIARKRLNKLSGGFLATCGAMLAVKT
ncbi:MULTISPECIES: LysE family translocator [Vibrio]|uniref:LysE family translocator n=1 Tax=Vibrio TaxID=662 RepID=UPI001F3AF07B|nr:LysE family translocator [Vibrio sp. TMPB1044]MCF7497035.1 LysE family translocator [Vibrio sp. L5-1]MDL5029122.1 LysE family translocator [Vibrio sp. TMPB1044]MDN5209250.1 LysE family translocator [Vibrio sp. TMPB1044]